MSAFIICQDEEAYIEDCLRSLDLCSEIVVVDSGSRDATIRIVRRLTEEGFPIRLYQEIWRGYAGQKQFALEQCAEEWCLNLDADERLDDELRQALPGMLAAPQEISAWRIRRRPYLIGYGYTPPYVYERPHLRLVRRGKGAYDLRKPVHESLRIEGRVRIARKGSLLHFRPLPIDEQILKDRRYSSLKAAQIVAERIPRPRFKMVLTPPYYFLRLYFARRLFLCGWPGFIQAMTGAIYSFMTEAKIYQQKALDADSAKARPRSWKKAAE